MERVTADNGKVSHIISSVDEGNNGRTVTTLCGKSFDETAIRVDAETDPCGQCDKKLAAAVKDSPDVVLPEE